MLKLFFRLFFGLFLLVASIGCGKSSGGDGGAGGGSSKLYGDIGTESSYCSSVTNPSSPVTITATATYRARQVIPSGVNAGLGDPADAPIRFAEVQVLNSGGTVVQCGTTDNSGAINLQMELAAGTYTLKVLSRASHASHGYISVLNNPTSMTPYSISASFSLSGGETTVGVTLSSATYTGTLEGGAFNILDQIMKSNEYMLANTSPVLTLNTTKARIFWAPGLSPGAYYGSPTAATSFFIPSDEADYGMATGIYLLGGINGSTCVDTDHFDNSVISHEFGHFLEKTYAYSDSPGGSHNGNSVIDPRIAWSEGWSNYYQGAVMATAGYYDTTGNKDCPTSGTALTVSLDLENKQIGHDNVNGSTYLGEGLFREVSVTRGLWDIQNTIASGTDSYGAGVGFAYIWNIFSDSSTGFRASSVHFRNMGKFNELMRAYISANSPGALTDFDNLVLNERQRSDQNEYARPITPQVSSCTFAIQGVNGVDNLAKTHDFFSYYYDGTAAHASINLKYAATVSGTPTDLDLYVWSESYAFTDSTTLKRQSAQIYPESGGAGAESVSLSGLAAGYYLVHVATDSNSVNNEATYYIETNSGAQRLCP